MAAPSLPRPLLAIDTAGEACSACVVDAGDGRLLARSSEPMARGHAEAVFGIVDAVLGEAGLAPRDLAAIAAMLGPGSFTGVRVGLSVAKGLGLALGVPVIGVSTLEALAAPHRRAGQPVLAVLDARRGELFAALFGASGPALAEPAAIEAEGLAAFLDGGSVSGALAVGSGAALACAALPDRLRPAPGSPAVEIADVARIAAGRIGAAGAFPPAPLYLRGADAKPQERFAVRRA